MVTRNANEKVLRLLEEAAKQIVRAAAEIQAKGIDTTQLSRPVLMLGDAIKELAQAGAPSSDAVIEEQPVESIAFTPCDSDQQSGA